MYVFVCACGGGGGGGGGAEVVCFYSLMLHHLENRIRDLYKLLIMNNAGETQTCVHLHMSHLLDHYAADANNVWFCSTNQV